jgi:hypothetical protein
MVIIAAVTISALDGHRADRVATRPAAD